MCLCNMQDALTSFAVDIDFMKIWVENLIPVLQNLDALFSWDCALKITKIELELLTNINMILDYENGIREGITRVFCDYVEINNKHLHDYDERKGSTCI